MTCAISVLEVATSGKLSVCPLVVVPTLLADTVAVALYSGFDRKARVPAVATVTINSKIGIQARRFKTRRYSRNSIFSPPQVRFVDFSVSGCQRCRQSREKTPVYGGQGSQAFGNPLRNVEVLGLCH